jgi:hypothetical protein
MANQSRTALLEFLDYLAKKGLMNRTTAAARKASANQVLGILDESAASDVSKLDLDAIMARFHHLHGSRYTPETLNVYKSRTKSAIDDFLRYQRDPLNFKPGIQPSQRKADQPKPKPSPSKNNIVRSETAQGSAIEPPPAAVNILPIPIRPDLTVKIQGLPFDLTISEATKIANVIKAMASEE